MKKCIQLFAALAIICNTAAGQNILLQEGFETWPASGWEIYELGVAGTWEQALGTGNTGDHSALHPYASEGQNKNWLVSPQITLDNTTNYQLSFYSMSYYTSGSISVRISTESGDPNTGDFEILEVINPSNFWMPVTIDLNAYQGQEVYIAFYAFTNAVLQWRVDDVLVAPVSYFDGAISQVASPSGFSPETGIEDIVVNVANHGTEPLSAFNIEWTVNDDFQPMYEASDLDLAPGADMDITIGQFDFSQGMYEISALINVPNDAWADNNFASTEYSAGSQVDVVLHDVTPGGSFPNSGTRAVIAHITNEGNVPLNDLTIEWSVNEVQQADVQISELGLASGESTSIHIDDYDFQDGVNQIELNALLNFDQTPENNNIEQSFTVGSFYENFEGSYPPLLWTTYFSRNGNFASQDSDPNNYHAYTLSINNNLDSADDTLYTPLLDIEDGDSFTFMGRFPGLYAATISLVWKDGETGEIHLIDELPIIQGWSEFTYDISDAAGINHIGWICSATGVIGDFNMDDVSSTASIHLLDNDLFVSGLNLDTVPQVNIEQTISVSVQNIGLNSVGGSQYTVKVFNGATELTSIEGTDIPATANIDFAIPYTFTEVGTLQLHAEVSFSDDESIETNTSKTLDVYPVPENTTFTNIGEPNYTGAYLPFNPVGFEFSGEQDLSQTLFYANEIGTAGEIYGIKYHYINFSAFEGSVPLKVWVASTNEESLESGWYPSEEFELVFDGEIEFNSTHGYTYVPFDVPLSYDGTTNLVVQNYIYDPAWIVPQARYVATTGTDEIRSLSIIDRALIDPSNPPQGYTSTQDFPLSTFVVSPAINAGVVSGFVVDTDNNPLANTEIFVDGTTVSTVTDESGAYTLQALPYGEYTITASLFSYDENSQVIEISQSIQELDFVLALKPLISLSANVVGSNNEEIPLANVSVSLGDYSTYSESTNSNGEFLVEEVYGNEEYTLQLSLYGFQDYEATISIAEESLDLGTIVLQETLLSPFNVSADGNAPATTISWEVPNTGIEETLVQDSGDDYAGFTNEPNENVWLGNEFINPGTITINDIDVYWSFVEGGTAGFVTVEILNEDEEVIATSEQFLTPYDQWINVDVPNMTITGNFYVMIHWEDNVSSTNYLSYNLSWDESIPNTGVIKYPNQDAQYLTDYLGTLYPVLNFMIRPNVISGVGNGNEYNEVSYNVYKGLSEIISDEIEDNDEWELLNSTPIESTEFIDNTWSDNSEDGTYLYAVEAVYSEGSSRHTYSNSVEIIITDTEDIIENSISVYPNPASEFLQISGIQGAQVFLFDTKGKLVYSQRMATETARLDVRPLASGSYVLNIVISDNVIAKKVFITKQ